jgi:hypothetical protein
MASIRSARTSARHQRVTTIPATTGMIHTAKRQNQIWAT